MYFYKIWYCWIFNIFRYINKYTHVHYYIYQGIPSKQVLPYLHSMYLSVYFVRPCSWPRHKSENFIFNFVDKGMESFISLISVFVLRMFKILMEFDCIFFLFHQVKEYLSRFSSIPDMLELDHLTVSGDVTFGKGVTLKVIYTLLSKPESLWRIVTLFLVKQLSTLWYIGELHLC